MPTPPRLPFALPILSALAVLGLPAGVGLAARSKAPPPTLEAHAVALRDEALASRRAWERMAFLADHIGPRLAGSAAMERAVAWGMAELAADGLRAMAEPVQVPHWVRGEEALEVVSPLPRSLAVHALGGSVGTPPEGLKAPVLVVSGFDDLTVRAAEAPGHLVLFDVPFESYGQAVQYRSRGAIAAARAGAVGALVRSPTPTSLYTPHTGAMRYEEGVPRVPAAAITVEDAAWMHRLSDAGVPVTVRLTLGARTEPDVPSANVVGEIRGRELPDEIVLLGCHLDSWDVTPGAQDDAAGCAAVMEAGRLLARHPPRRTVRIVLFANEENGLRGGRTYAEAHADEIPRIRAALEVDLGAGPPLGFDLLVSNPSTGQADPVATEALSASLAPYVPLLAPTGATRLAPGGTGADISPLAAAGVPTLGLAMDTAGYWPVHHTAADTPEKVDPATLARVTAATTVMGWVLAERP